MAAQLAYYFFFALFPALLFLIAAGELLPARDADRRHVRACSAAFAPPEALSIITDQIRKISEGRTGRPADARHAAGALEHLGGDDVDHRHAECGLRHRRRPSLVESPADGHRPDDRRVAVHPRLVRADPGRADGGAVDRRSDAARQRVRLDLDDPAVAARLPAREHGDRHRLLLRARRRAGLGLADAGLDFRDARCGSRRRSASSSTSPTSATTRKPTAPSAASWC